LNIPAFPKLQFWNSLKYDFIFIFSQGGAEKAARQGLLSNDVTHARR
jgi:hypothetical protein